MPDTANMMLLDLLKVTLSQKICFHWLNLSQLPLREPDVHHN